VCLHSIMSTHSVWNSSEKCHQMLLFYPEADLLHTQTENEVFWNPAMGAEYFKILPLSTWEKSLFVTGISDVLHLCYVMSWECPLSFCINGDCQAQSTDTLQSDLWPDTSILQMAPLLITEFACIHSKQSFLNL